MIAQNFKHDISQRFEHNKWSEFHNRTCSEKYTDEWTLEPRIIIRAVVIRLIMYQSCLFLLVNAWWKGLSYWRLQNMEPSPDFRLFSSLLYSPSLSFNSANTVVCKSSCPFYLLPYHRDRIVSAARHFNWLAAIAALQDLGELRRQCEEAVVTFPRDQIQSHHVEQEQDIALKVWDSTLGR